MSASDTEKQPPRLHPKYVKSERLGRRITEYKAWLNAGEYKWLMMVREFDREGLWQLEGIRSCAHWLNWKCSIGMNAAREKVRVASALADLPKVSERYRKGELSYSKVRAITRIATPDNEDYLLQIARHGTASHVEGLVSKYRRCKRRQEAKSANRQHALRGLTWFYDDDGAFVLRGRLPAEQGALIVKALGLAVERMDAETRAERAALHEDSANACCAAETARSEPADAELAAARPGAVNGAGVSAATSADGDARPANAGRVRRRRGNSADQVRPPEPFSVRRADGLAQLAETYLADGPKSTSSADRFQVVVHVSAERLKAAARDDDVSAETPDAAPPDGHVSAETQDLFDTDFSYLEDGPHVSAETARRLGCNASKIGVTDGEDGEPLNIGRKSRIIPPGIRRALRMRDAGCRFPGCTHKHFIDGHHIRHWADGGETSLENLVQLCRFHHRLVHEGGFGCARREDGKFVFTTRNGVEIPDYGFLPPVPGNRDPFGWLRDDLDEPEIDAGTCVTKWIGERIDWPLAVGHLFDR